MNQASFEEKMAAVEKSFSRQKEHEDWLAYHAKMAAMTLPKNGACVVDEKNAVMNERYFEELGEYSTTLPTGAYIGKRWKRNVNVMPHWKCRVCGIEYVGWEIGPCKNDPHDGTLPGQTSLELIEVKPKWWMGEYFELKGRTDEVGIRWREIILT